MDGHNTPPLDGSHRSGSENNAARSALVNGTGVVTGLTGVVFALITLSTPVLKLVGVLFCVTVGAVVLQAARERDRGMLSNPLLTWLTLAGVSTLILVVLLAGQQAESPIKEEGAETSASNTTPSTSDPETPKTTLGTTTMTSSSPTSPSVSSNVVWLIDMQRVESDRPDIDPWMTKTVQVKGVSYNKSLAAVEFWCGRTQIDYIVGGKYSRLQASVGIADDSPRTEPLNFYILADEQRIKTISDVRIAAPQSVDVSIDGVTRIAIGIESPLTPDDRSGGDCPGTERTGAWIDPSLVPSGT